MICTRIIQRETSKIYLKVDLSDDVCDAQREIKILVTDGRSVWESSKSRVISVSAFID